jgi:predicted GIY-YIG superfamily endonuclease
MEYVCYVIASHDGRRTYAGCTNHLARRIRQHNREISGGAKATSGFAPCRVLFVVRGFGSNRIDALRFEWRLKVHRNWCRELRRCSNSFTRRDLLLAKALNWADNHLAHIHLIVDRPPFRF